MPKLKASKKTLIAAISTVVTAVLIAVGVTVWLSQPITVNRPKIFTSKDVGMQMFGWNWNSLASECTNEIGPAGIDWILVDPPQDHKRGTQWWIHYQPANYDIISDHGTREQFAAMVSSCKAAGVSVVADAVLNHMAGEAGLSFNGKPYGVSLKFGDLYNRANFHEGLDENDKHWCGGDIVDWEAFDERTNCRFPGLPDLATEQDYVRQTIATYLNDLLSLGVAGFRFDAAKHMQPQDIAAIYNKLDRPAYLVQEIPGDAAINAEYLGNGDVWAWQAASDFSSMFAYASKMDTEAPGWSEFLSLSYPSDQSVTWVSNHDTERHGGSLTYRDPVSFEMASLYLLAQPFGKPMLYSGYRFVNNDAGVEQDDNGFIKDAVCGPDNGEFTCYQRYDSIAGMIAWHKEVNGTEITIENGASGIYSVSRGGKGLFILNYNKTAMDAQIATDLADGTYCDLISAGNQPIADGSCLGTELVVEGNKVVSKFEPLTAFAISASTRLG